MARDRELILGLQSADVGTSALPFWPWKLHQLRPVLVSAAVAVGLHAIVLSVQVRGQRSSVDLVEPLSSSTPAASSAVRVRTVAARNANAPIVDAGSMPESASVVGLPVSDPLHSQTVAEFAGRDMRAPVGSDPARASPPLGGLVLHVAGALTDEDFFPRAALDMGPSPTMPILIDYPPFVGGLGTQVGMLALFIDEKGKVVRLHVDTQTLPQEMQDAARAAFIGATFTPGFVDGLPVRSRIRVEVIFESGTPPR